MITDYKIVESQSGNSRDLEEKVKALIADGWTPLGSVAISAETEQSFFTYAQAMTKDDSQSEQSSPAGGGE